MAGEGLTDATSLRRSASDMVIGGATLVETGVVWQDVVTVDQWMLLAPFLQRTSHAWRWWVGDWLAYGDQQRWGEKYDQAMAIFDLDYQVLADCKWVSSQVPIFLRERKLSWTHHKMVAKFDHAQQREWLSACLPAADDLPPKMTSGQLLKAIRGAEKADRMGRPREEIDVLEDVQEKVGALGMSLNRAQCEFGGKYDRVSAVVACWFDLAGEWKDVRDVIESDGRASRGIGFTGGE